MKGPGYWALWQSGETCYQQLSVAILTADYSGFVVGRAVLDTYP
jgi:hypothetical protein